MAITSEIVPTGLLREVNALNAAGLPFGQIADRLNTAGFAVPREQPPGGDARHGRHEHGYAFDTGNATPGRWTPAAVVELLATPEAASTNNYAAALAKLGSDATTTLTVT